MIKTSSGCYNSLHLDDDESREKQIWKEKNYLSVKYHLEQIAMQLGSCELQVELDRLDDQMLQGYIGEIEYQLKGLRKLADCD